MEYPALLFDCVGLEKGSQIPVDYTGRGQNQSPEFVLKNLSPQAVTLAVTLEDLSHPIKNFTHWVIWNLPAAERIKGGIPAGRKVAGLGTARQGIAYGFYRYAGPKPPRGKRHIYRFSVYALDCEIRLGVVSTKKAFLKAAEGHILQKGSIEGTFES